MPDIPATLKDAAYVTVGLGVLAFQRAQVQRVELTKQARQEMDRLSGSVEDRLKTVEERLGGLQEQVERAIDDLGERLPEPAAGALRTALHTAKEAQVQLRHLVGGPAEDEADGPAHAQRRPGRSSSGLAQRAASPKSKTVPSRRTNQ